MRLNKYIARHTSFSRRAADKLVTEGRALVNGKVPKKGQTVDEADTVTIDGNPIDKTISGFTSIIFNKPQGFVCSRRGQGSRTIYELLPPQLQHLNSVGRLDKDSSGLLLLTNDGNLANQLTHPRYKKIKVYEVGLDKPLQPLHRQMISEIGVNLEDGLSKFQIEKMDKSAKKLQVTMKEGRNRQIRRTFYSLDYTVISLHRTTFGEYTLDDLGSGKFKEL